MLLPGQNYDLLRRGGERYRSKKSERQYEFSVQNRRFLEEAKAAKR